MDFDKIVLTFYETFVLKRSLKSPVKKSKCDRLLRLKLVSELKEQSSPGGFPVGVGLCSITDFGRDYLLYRKDFNRTRFSVPIIVSVITTLLVNGIIQLLPLMLELLQQLI